MGEIEENGNNKLLDLIYSKSNFLLLNGTYILRNGIEYFLENKINLEYTYKIRYFIDNFDYYYSYNKIEAYKEYEELILFMKKNNINEKYYGFKNWEDLVKGVKRLKNKGISRNKEGYIYIIKQGEFYKIGKTININKRLKKYITENPNNIEMIHYYKVEDTTLEEEKLHLFFKSKNHNREWFKLNNDDILYIKNLSEGY